MRGHQHHQVPLEPPSLTSPLKLPPQAPTAPLPTSRETSWEDFKGAFMAAHATGETI